MGDGPSREWPRVSERVGIMQGRLLPSVDGRIQAFPGDRWPEEFDLARRIGFEAIEFVFEGDPWHHPLLRSEGRAQIRQVVERSSVLVQSVCADYFMAHPFHGVDRAVRRVSREVLRALVPASAEVGARVIVLPCVDASSLRTAADRAVLLDTLVDCLPVLDANGVTLALETDLDAADFATLLKDIPSRRVGVNYDMGNSASLGFDPVIEFDAYGDRVVSVHVKDRKRHGHTVPLGSGDTDFVTCFSRLKKLHFAGPLTIQAARGADDVATAVSHLEVVRAHLGADG
jgi:L-ribulose-5-phosphate 3-epimerase